MLGERRLALGEAAEIIKQRDHHQIGEAHPLAGEEHLFPISRAISATHSRPQSRATPPRHRRPRRGASMRLNRMPPAIDGQA